MRRSFPAKIVIVQSPCKHVVEAFAAIAGLVDVKMCVVAGGVAWNMLLKNVNGFACDCLMRIFAYEMRCTLLRVFTASSEVYAVIRNVFNISAKKNHSICRLRIVSGLVKA